MSTLVIEGGHRLRGEFDVEGNKNAALPIIAACLLTDKECQLHNVPRIADVEVMCRLLLDLGAEVDGIGTTSLRIKCETVTKDEPDAGAGGTSARLCVADGAAPRTSRPRDRCSSGR